MYASPNMKFVLDHISRMEVIEIHHFQNVSIFFILSYRSIELVCNKACSF